jgi:small multidrug resistance family-3 protein
MLIVGGCSCWRDYVRDRWRLPCVGVGARQQAAGLGTARGRDPRGLRGGGRPQPISEFGRVYAAYGGVFIALALAWGVLVDGFRPDRWDLLGAAICVVGVLVMVVPPRG